MHPNDFIWQELHLLNQKAELAVQAFAFYTEWFLFVAAVFLAAVLLVILCIKGIQHIKGLTHFARKPHQATFPSRAGEFFVNASSYPIES